MLGDTGSNLIGAVAGVWLLTVLGDGRPPGRSRGRPGADDLRRVAVYFDDDRFGSAPALARLARQSMSPGNKGDTQFIFVTGGVVSALGKGITAASIGRLLVSRGYRVQLQKFDPYINVDPGTMSPFQHGEVFVTEDGAETDLDLGHYERFTDENALAGLERHRRRGLQLGDQARAPRRLPRRHGPGDPAHHQRDQAENPHRRRVAVGRLRDHRDRRHRRRHRVAAVPRVDPPALHRPRAEAGDVRPPDPGALRRPRRRTEDEADPALGQRAAPDRDPAARAGLPLRGAPRPRDPQQDRPLRQPSRRRGDLRP